MPKEPAMRATCPICERAHCEHTPDDFAAEIERLREELDDQKAAIAEEVQSNLELFDLLGLRTGDDFGHDTPNAAIARKFNEMKARAERAESAIAAREARAAGLVAACSNAWAAFDDAYTGMPEESWMVGPREQLGLALAATGLECVPGWVDMASWPLDEQVVVLKHKVYPAMNYATIVIHKEQQHGA